MKIRYKISILLNIVFIIYIFVFYQSNKEYITFLNKNTFYDVIISAYNSKINQTDNTPFITANGTKPNNETIALSRDIILNKINYGDTITVILIKDFVVTDTMHKRHTNKADIWTKNVIDALKFGKVNGYLIKRKK
jgi:3D (Asp-Asp-Asp) domain-containing protein